MRAYCLGRGGRSRGRGSPPHWRQYHQAITIRISPQGASPYCLLAVSAARGILHSFMRIVLAILCYCCLITASAARPNIVVIMTDDQEDTGSTAYMPK